MPLFGRKETPEEERARRAHEEIDAADAAAQAAREAGQQARAHALAVAEEESRGAQTHVDDVTSREQERVAAVTAEAKEEVARAVRKAEDKAQSKIAAAEQAAQEAIAHAQETAAAHRAASTARAEELRGHAGAAPRDAHQDAPERVAGWYADPQGEAAYRWWDGTNWTNQVSATV